MSTHLTSAQFMRELPAAVRRQLPGPLQKFRTAGRSWLCQLYYSNPKLHYEFWNLGERRGVLEIGLHFESPDRALNERLLHGFMQYMMDIKVTLGRQWEAEYWDKGWTKVYETIPREPFSADLLDTVSRRMAKSMTILTPILDDILQR